MTLYQTVETEFRCPHLNTAIRYRDTVTGTRQYRAQCLNCGDGVGNFIKHSDIESPALVEPFDDRLEESYNCLKRDRYNELNQVNRQSWWDEYNAYMQTPEWKQRRAQVLKRDRHICQACLNAVASEVHHKTYDHFKQEPLFDLVAVCRPCHEIITAMDRSKYKWMQ
jgi:5-methylcytosine-specific restriction endonuclease McrA